MKCISITFAIAAVVTGLVAAVYWYKSGTVPINQNQGPDWGLPGTGVRTEPVDPDLKALDLSVASIDGILATNKAMREAARLNKIAARWTAVSVSCSGLSAIFGAWACK